MTEVRDLVRPAAAGQLPRSRNAPLRWGVPIIATAAALASISVQGSADQIGSYGLISAIPAAAIVATLVLGLSFFVAVGSARPDRALLGLHVAALAVVLTLAPLLVEHTARFPTAYLHAGFSDYIERHGEILRSFDARFSWPGFFALVAVLAKLTGVQPLAFAGLANLFLILFELPLVYGIAASLTEGVRRPWLATWFYLVADWVGQDYFGPQGLNLLFFLAVLYVAVRFLRPDPPSAAGGDAVTGRLRAFWRRLLAREARPIHLGRTARITVVAVLVVVLAASVVSHQLTPTAIAAILFALLLSNRLTAKSLPILVVVMIFSWLSYAATDYWTGHLAVIFGSLGKIGSSVSSNVGQRVTGSPAHLEIVHIRLIEPALVGLVAAFGLIRGLRTRGGITLAVLLATPITLVAAQDYGGEAALRVYLYSLPAAATALAVAFFPTERPEFVRRRSFAAAVLGMVLLALFPFSRYGNESFESFTPGDVAAARYAVERTPPDTIIVLLNGNTPIEFANIEQHPYRIVAPTSLSDIAPSVGDVRAAMRAAGANSVLYVSPSEFRLWHNAADAAANSEAAFVRTLRADPNFVETYANGKASVWRLSR